jgi:hypothetical protein
MNVSQHVTHTEHFVFGVVAVGRHADEMLSFRGNDSRPSQLFVG